MDTPATPSDDNARLRARWLALLWAVAAPALIGVTCPLWSGLTPIPSLPAASFLASVPGVAEYVLLGAVGWGALCVLRGRRRVGLVYGGVGLAGLMALDQLRWQPWAYHLFILGLVLLLAAPPLAVRLLRTLAISVYVFSAIAKLDYAFASTLGRQMLDAAAGLVGLKTDAWPQTLLIVLALTMPIAEGALGPLLAFKQTRRAALVLASVMHLGAVVFLGPLGLGHRPGVLLWNLVFLAHLWLLFGPIKGRANAIPVAAPTRHAWSRWAAMVVILVAVVGPLTRPLGLWDRWPSWGLYAPGGERTEVFAHRSVIDRLPPSLPMDDPGGQADWLRLRLDDWSLEASWAPVYPQRRTTLGIALALQSDARLGDFLRVDLQGPADRFTGERQTETLLGAKAIDDYASRYWLNASTARRR